MWDDDGKSTMIPIESCVTPLKDRSSYVYVECGELDVVDGAFVINDVRGIRATLPIGFISCLMLGPGTTITHAAVKLASDVRCLLLWVGQNGVRLYSAGMVGGARCDRLLTQASASLNDDKRRVVVRRMYQYRFEETFEPSLSIEQMRGKEAARVKNRYLELSREYGVEWKGRRYDARDWRSADPVNRCISTATSCLYGMAEAAILIAGYSPAIGFIHTGRPRSFVYDVADLVKYETVVPLAFKIASEYADDYERRVRLECRDVFGRDKVLESMIPLINSLFTGIDEIDSEGVVSNPYFSDMEGRFYDDSADC